MKFLPPRADALPASAFWSPDGDASFTEQPEVFRREELTRLREHRWRLVGELRQRYLVGS